MQITIAHATLMQEGMQGVAHIVVGLSPLVDHDYAWLVEMQLKVFRRVEVQGASRVIGDRHARLAYVGVWPVDVDFVKACALDDNVLDCSLANAWLASKVN